MKTRTIVFVLHRLLFVLVIYLLACTAPPTEADLVIRNARLLVGDGTLVDTATIVVDEGRIVAVGDEVGDWLGLDEIDAALRKVGYGRR